MKSSAVRFWCGARAGAEAYRDGADGWGDPTGFTKVTGSPSDSRSEGDVERVRTLQSGWDSIGREHGRVLETVAECTVPARILLRGGCALSTATIGTGRVLVRHGDGSVAGGPVHIPP
jgi:hypothetical protein